MKRLLLTALCLAGAGPVLAQGAPFCLVSGLGQQCTHYSLDACQSAARTLDGMCVANVQAQQPVQPTQIQQIAPQGVQPANSFWQSFADSQERAQRVRQQQELHRAQVGLLEAQAARALAQPVIRYLCSTPERGMHVTETPEIGCTVVEINR